MTESPYLYLGNFPKISSEKGDPLDVISGSHVPRYVLLDMLCVVVDAEAAALKSGP